MDLTAGNRVVLNSWKEIAQHLGRGVRTVQRWEHDLGLPVRRPRGTSRSAVVALSDELDSWLRSTPKNQLYSTQEPSYGERARGAAVVATVRHAMAEGMDLRDRCIRLCAEHSLVISTLMHNLAKMTKTLEAGRQQREPESERLPPASQRSRMRMLVERAS